MTGGDKFGGDFLAYPADPVAVHAQAIIICMEKEEISNMSEAQLVAKTRLGTSVNKNVILAYFDEENTSEVMYKSLAWTGKV